MMTALHHAVETLLSSPLLTLFCLAFIYSRVVCASHGSG